MTAFQDPRPVFQTQAWNEDERAILSPYHQISHSTNSNTEDMILLLVAFEHRLLILVALPCVNHMEQRSDPPLRSLQPIICLMRNDRKRALL